MTSMQAALGLSQLGRLDTIVSEKRQIGLAYRELFKSDSEFQLQTDRTEYSVNQYWVVGVLLPEGIDMRIVADRMRKQGVDSRPFFFPLHQQPVLKKFGLENQASLPVSERLGRRGLYLPSFIGITEEQILMSADALKKAI